MDKEIINNIKALSIDMIEKAGSGHPGIALGAAPIIYTLFAKHLNISTSDSKWLNRDRFVLSAGHGSALLYATLFMAGYDLSIEDLKQFRRAGSKTPGHPEYGMTPGVDMSTGPLGQGFASAVGMALGEKILKTKHVIPKKDKKSKERSLIDYNVYVLCGEGDLMEGISYEAASLAGSLNLDNLIVLYDSNNVTLDGDTSDTFTENILDRFKAMGWHTELVRDGLIVDDIDKAISKAKNSGKPSIIEIKTIIGIGTSLAGSNEVHGKVLDAEDVEQLKRLLNVPQEPFYVNYEASQSFRKMITERSNRKYEEWSRNYREYVNDVLKGKPEPIQYLFHDDIKVDLINREWDLDNEKEATRVTNGKIMNKLAPLYSNFIGGSADVSSSTKAYLNKYPHVKDGNFGGRNILFGIREHSMGAILNGLALSGFRTFGSTFLAFADYLKPAIRMSALMNLPVTYIFTHDSIMVGQDGPTHQPIEQLAMLRSIPNMRVFRPADGKEIIGCWNEIMNQKGPATIVLSRTDVEQINTTNAQSVSKGAYIVRQESQALHGIIIATGTEVQTALNIANELYQEQKLDIRVVSMPSQELFLKQTVEYQEQILPKTYRKIVIEGGSSYGWHRFVYSDKYLITVDQFGISGTKDEVLKHCYFDYQTIKQKVEKLLK